MAESYYSKPRCHHTLYKLIVFYRECWWMGQAQQPAKAQNMQMMIQNIIRISHTLTPFHAANTVELKSTVFSVARRAQVLPAASLDNVDFIPLQTHERR